MFSGDNSQTPGGGGNGSDGNTQGNLNDPLFLSNSDHPGSQLVDVLFDGTNFMHY